MLKRHIIFQHFKSFLPWMLVSLALSVNQASAYLLVLLWKIDVPYYMLINFGIILLFSAAIRSFTKAMALVLVSLVFGAIIAIITLIMPPLIYGQNYMINYTIDAYITFVGRTSIFSLIVCVLAVTIGSILSNGFE